jgi:Zn-dependent membrane protease YugP
VDIAELRVVGLDDPISIVLGVGGLVILAAGIVMAGLLHRPVGRRLIVVGVAMMAGAVIYTLVAGWLAPAS